MKKSLLFSAALVAAGSALAAAPSLQKADASTFEIGLKAPEAKRMLTKAPATRASETFMFSYSQGIYSLTKISGVTGGVSRAYLLFQLSKDDIKGLAGDKVTGFYVVSPSNQNMNSNSITEGRFFYSFDLSKEEYSQDFTLSTTPFDLNEVSIDTPYTITGEEEGLFFGYSILVPKTDNMYYLPFDGAPNPYQGAGLFGVSNTDAFPAEIYTFAPDLGALTMALTLEGDNFPNYAQFLSVPDCVYLPLGAKSKASVTLSATTPDPIESVEFEYTLGGQAYTYLYELPTALDPGPAQAFNAEIEFPALNEKLSEDVTITISKFNGKENEAEGASAVVPVTVLSKVPVRQTLYEEYTSTSCMWCTRGFAALEYIKKNYPSFVTASFHTTYSSPQDPMQVMTSFPSQVSGYPSAVLNRGEQVDPFYGSQSYMDMTVPVIGDILALNAMATPWDISVSHEWASDDVLVAKAKVANMLGYEDQDYKIAYILVADGLTGTGALWKQLNGYYSQNAEPSFPAELAEFCRGGKYGQNRVEGLVFNDVVVSSNGVKGVAGSVPTSLAAEETVSHSLEFDLSKISSTLIPDRNKLRVIAAVVDANGNVLNCAKDEVNDNPGTTAVDGLDSTDNAPAEYYNLNGMKVAEPSNGIFIRRQGGKAEKVVIR